MQVFLFFLNCLCSFPPHPTPTPHILGPCISYWFVKFLPIREDTTFRKVSDASSLLPCFKVEKNLASKDWTIEMHPCKQTQCYRLAVIVDCLVPCSSLVLIVFKRCSNPILLLLLLFFFSMDIWVQIQILWASNQILPGYVKRTGHF